MITKELLKNKNTQEKHHIKTDEHCTTKPFNFSMNGFQIKVKEISKEITGKERGLLKVVVEVKKNGTPVFVDNPLYFFNPPITIPDGTKSLVQGNAEFGEKMIEVDNYKVDVKEAMKRIIFDTVFLTHKEI